MNRKPINTRLWNDTIRDEKTGCLNSTKSTDRWGYPHIWWNGRLWIASRVAWTLTFGEIPSGMLVCHTCDNPQCIEPSHLFLGTNKTNVDDMIRKGRGYTFIPRKGLKHHNARFSDETIEKIRSAKGTQKEIALRFGCSRQYVGDIKNNRYRA